MLQHGDSPKALTKSRELQVHALLETNGIPFESQVCVPFAGCGLQSDTKHAMLDFVVNLPHCKVIVEVDEHQHAHYAISCEIRRECDVVASITLGSADKLAFIRYNPDSYQVGGIMQNTPKREREQKLLQILRELEQEPESQLTRVFLYYNMQSHDSLLPIVAEAWPAELKQITRCVA